MLRVGQNYFDQAMAGGVNQDSGNLMMNELLGAALSRGGHASRPMTEGSGYAYYPAPGMGRSSTRHADKSFLKTGKFIGDANAEGMYMHPFSPDKWHLRNVAPTGMFGPNTAEREKINSQYYQYPNWRVRR